MSQPAPLDTFDAGGLPAAFHFTLSLVDDAPGAAASRFQEVEGLQAEVSVDGDAVAEGGENRFVHRLPKGIKPQSLVLKRGVVAPTAALVAWCREVLEGGLAQPVQKRTLRLSLVDASGQALRVWVLDGAWPVKWSVDALASSQHEVVIEVVALHYASCRREV